jgi:hypothetical protein
MQYRHHEPEADWMFRPSADHGRGQVFRSAYATRQREKLAEIKRRNPWEHPGVQAKMLIKLCFRWLRQHDPASVPQPKEVPVACAPAAVVSPLIELRRIETELRSLEEMQETGVYEQQEQYDRDLKRIAELRRRRDQLRRGYTVTVPIEVNEGGKQS